jgi:hypothetical protein
MSRGVPLNKAFVSRISKDNRYKRSEDWRVVVEHGFADDLNGGEAMAHEVVVERLQAEGVALRLHQVGSEFHDFKLAESVVQIGSVGGAPLGFDQGDA